VQKALLVSGWKVLQYCNDIVPVVSAVNRTELDSGMAEALGARSRCFMVYLALFARNEVQNIRDGSCLTGSCL